VIPKDYITEWRREAPWVEDFQVEQDLVISRALVELFSHPTIKHALAFRGGTALYKLFLRPAARYSEDIDLVQRVPGAIGSVFDAIKDVLNPWLGEPKRDQKQGRMTLTYRFSSEDMPPVPLRLKVEINSREHFSVYGFREQPLAVESRWFRGSANIPTYDLDELLGTKLRALYQRKKGRDLFDLARALEVPGVDPVRVVAAFGEYLKAEDKLISRAEFERNLADKRIDPAFGGDIRPLLAHGHRFDSEVAFQAISKLIALLPGEPWKGAA
jgi:predicted nucleotidyltransferase component of viral defense system